MKKKNYFYLAWALITAISLSGCDETEKDDSTDHVPVETIEATANFDLTSRSKWKLTIGGIEYSTTINGNKITGTAPETPYYFTENTGKTYIYLRPDYSADIHSEKEVLIYPQNTFERLIMFDYLLGEYNAEATEHVKGVKLKHVNILLDFTLNGLPEETEVTIQRGDLTLLPYRDEDNPEQFLGILTPTTSYEPIRLVIEIDEKKYEEVIDISQAYPRAAALPQNYLSGLMFTFEARLEDAPEGEDKTILIENIQVDEEKWSIE